VSDNIRYQSKPSISSKANVNLEELEKDINKINIFKKYWFVKFAYILIFLLVLFNLVHVYFGIGDDISKDVGDWADYSTYIANSITALLTPIILFFLIATFELQRSAFREQKDSVAKQIESPLVY